MPRVSIGMPVYNGELFIRQSVESLLAQTYGDFELVITDNASKDGTEEVCREFEKKDKRVRYVRNDKNLGGPGNFRRVFDTLQRGIHKWSTADDYLGTNQSSRNAWPFWTGTGCRPLLSQIEPGERMWAVSSNISKTVFTSRNTPRGTGSFGSSKKPGCAMRTSG